VHGCVGVHVEEGARAGSVGCAASGEGRRLWCAGVVSRPREMVAKTYAGGDVGHGRGCSWLMEERGQPRMGR